MLLNAGSYCHFENPCFHSANKYEGAKFSYEAQLKTTLNPRKYWKILSIT